MMSGLPPALAEQENGWGPEPVWVFWRIDKTDYKA